MAYIEGHARDQALLLPASVEDYVAADSSVRFIDAFVDDLDLGKAGFMRTRPKATGRPGYDPADRLRLYLYGYLKRVRSSRRLATEAVRNLEQLEKSGEGHVSLTYPDARAMVAHGKVTIGYNAQVAVDANHMRGLEKIGAGFRLTALAYNLGRAITLIGVPELIRAVQA